LALKLDSLGIRTPFGSAERVLLDDVLKRTVEHSSARGARNRPRVTRQAVQLQPLSVRGASHLASLRGGFFDKTP
jgi:hypothetical protein